jgi:hypothetical protein
MKEITCTNGMKALVDDDMYEVLNQYEWHVTPKGYAYTIAYAVWGQVCMLAMMHHCVIGRSVYDLMTDHKNRIRLDNQRENLHQVTRSENRRNSKWFDTHPCKTPPIVSEPVWADRRDIYKPYPSFPDLDMPTDDEMAKALDRVKASQS